MGVRWLEKSEYIRPFVAYEDPYRQKASSNILVSTGRRRRAAPSGTVDEVISNQVHMLFEHPCSSSITARIVRRSFFPIPSFLTNWLLMCNDIVVKNYLALRGSRRNDALEILPFSHVLLLGVPGIMEVNRNNFDCEPINIPRAMVPDAGSCRIVSTVLVGKYMKGKMTRECDHIQVNFIYEKFERAAYLLVK